MSSCREALLALIVAVSTTAIAAPSQPPDYPGIGRAATASELAAWDIDVRPDFKGLPAGSGSVAKGMQVWEGKCASCHGVFGESNEVFAPLVGGTTAEDIRTGRVANLKRSDYPGRTTLMKATHVSTLWDYINRAMPWSQPKSLSVEEVYAVTGYLLHLGGIVPADFTLSDRNIAQVQQRMPNRKGATQAHAFWPGREFGAPARPDVQASACMKDCAVAPKVASLIPDFARNAHGDLAQQNRLVGPQRGVHTPVNGQQAAASTPVAAAGATANPAASKALALAQSNNCTACHAAKDKLVGPSWSEIARRHQGKADYLADKIRSGGAGVWGAIPMPPQALAEGDARAIADWLASGAP